MAAIEVFHAMRRALTYPERRVLMFRFGLDGHAPLTLSEVAGVMKLPRERIREVENVALAKLSASLERSEDG